MKGKEKEIDKRMQWILALEECEKNGGKQAHFVEYEICSEARIPGVLDYANGALLCGIFQEADDRGLYTYTVKVKYIDKEYEFDASNYSKDGYYFKDGLIGELMVLFSVYFQARFYLKGITHGELSPGSLRMRDEKEFQHKKPKALLNAEMFSPSGRNWAYEDGLKGFLDSIRDMDPKYHQRLIQSFYWYSEAIKEIGVSHSLFFIKMVSSVEALLKSVAAPPDELESKLKKSIKNGFTKEEKGEISNWLENRKISKKFVTFLQEYSDGFFGKVPETAPHCYIKANELGDYAKRIYTARSKYLHEGRSMYLSSDMLAEESKYWDVDPALGEMNDRRKIPGDEKLPRARWFERIVNHCLKNFLNSHSKTL